MSAEIPPSELYLRMKTRFFNPEFEVPNLKLGKLKGTHDQMLKKYAEYFNYYFPADDQAVVEFVYDAVASAAPTQLQARISNISAQIHKAGVGGKKILKSFIKVFPNGIGRPKVTTFNWSLEFYEYSMEASLRALLTYLIAREHANRGIDDLDVVLNPEQATVQRVDSPYPEARSSQDPIPTKRFGLSSSFGTEANNNWMNQNTTTQPLRMTITNPEVETTKLTFLSDNPPRERKRNDFEPAEIRSAMSSSTTTVHVKITSLTLPLPTPAVNGK